MTAVMMRLPHFVILAALLPVHAIPANAESAALPEAANFSLRINAQEPVSEPLPAGAFRIHLGSEWISGGGVAEAPGWSERFDAQPADRGLRMHFDGTAWNSAEIALPEPVAWAGVATHGDQLLVVGGLREGGVSTAVSRWRLQGDSWQVEALPDLPLPLAWAGAAVMDGRLHVAGGDGPAGPNTGILSIDLGAAGKGAQWQNQPLDDAAVPWLEPQLVVRRDEVAIRNALYLLGGWTDASAAATGWETVSSVYKFLPPGGARAGLYPMAPLPAGHLVLPASGLGPAHVLTGAFDPAGFGARPALLAATAHPPAQFLRYHVFTDTWTTFSSPLQGPVTYIGWREKKALLLATADGTGTEQVAAAEISATERHFAFFDYLVMVLYMLGLVAIGRYFASRERGTEDFFLGGRRVPWWAAGLSIYATGTSAISFMAIPAKTYSTDWLYFIGMSIFPFFTVTIAAFVFIPLLRRLEITTVMEYFELRFGRPVRLLMSAVAVLGQVAGRMSITLLLPSIALTAVTGMNIYACILVMGVLATIYTAVGGINAVIWTDVLQVFVLFGGALLSFALIAMRVDGGMGSILTLAVADDKFNLLDVSWDFTTATIWIMLLWAVSDVFGKGLGQEGLQRAFSTRGVREARRSMITCAVVALPAGFLFYGIGTALYAFYHSHPELLNPTLQTDAIFPLFIAQQLPVGLAGLVISGLFAASMSTLDTAMNTSATIFTRDFYSIWRKDASDHERLVLARWVTVFCGAFGTGVALYMASFKNLGSLWDMFSILLGVIGGGLGGVGVLALCTTRANTRGTLAGALVTAVSIVLIQRYTPVHFFIYGTLSMAIGSVTGYLFSLLFPDEKKDLTGLTLWTPARDAD
jgi:SSS family transporter